MSFNDDLTRVWVEPDTGIQYALGPGECTRAGATIPSIPTHLLLRDPDHVFGALVPWAGGERPVSADAVVRCLFRYGGRRPYIGAAAWGAHSTAAQRVMWHHAPAPGRINPGSDIVAYQVEVTSG